MDANEVMAKRLDFQFKTNKIILNELKCCCSNLYKEIADCHLTTPYLSFLEYLSVYHSIEKLQKSVLYQTHYYTE